MYKIAVIALLFACAIAHPKFQDTKTVLSEIDAEPFGNLILSTIQAQLQTKTPTDEINMLLNQIVAQIISDQSDHDRVQRTNQAACDRIVLDLENGINYHNTQISSNTKLRDDTTQALAQAEDDLRQTIKDISNNEATYAREEATRQEQHNVWVQKDAEHTEAIEAVDDASKLIQHLSLGASFAQVKSKYDAITRRLNENTAHEALLKPLVVALAELSTNVDQKALTRIAQLLAQLRQQLVEAQGVLQETEDRQVARWAEFSAHLTEERSRLVERKQGLENQINAYHTTINDANELLEFHTLELEVVEEGLSGQNQWCETQLYVYTTQSTERERQQEIITRIQEHLIEKLASTAQYVAGRF